MTERERIVTELLHLEKDLQMFTEQRGLLYRRFSDMEHDWPDRLEEFRHWPAVQVIDNGFILAIVKCEGLITDYRRILSQMEVPDNVRSIGRPDE